MNSAGVGGYFFGGGGAPGIKQIQSGTADLNNVTSVTATISAVVLANTAVYFPGLSSASAATTKDKLCVRGELTNTTTVTFTRVTADANATPCAYVAKEYNVGFYRSMQRGTVDLNGVTSITATVSAVTVAKSTVTHLGFSYNNGADLQLNQVSRWAITNTTTLTATVGSAVGTTQTTGYQLEEEYV